MGKAKTENLHTVGGIALQKPAWVFFGGRIRPWEDALLHVSTEAVNRGLNVFEGLKGYWHDDGRRFGLVALPRHFARLHRSARLLHIPCDLTYEEFEAACHQLVKVLANPDKDMWIRATLFVTEGHWGEGTVADLYLTGYQQDKTEPAAINIGVSTWQRAADNVLSPRIKTSANYNVARLARIEGRERGFSEMVLLNQWGRVAEATGACLLVVRNGQVVTPPASEGRLESITVEIVAAICASLKIPFVERPIDRTELYVAEEIRLVGTLAEIVPVRRIDHYILPERSPVLDEVAKRFWQAVRGVKPHEAIDLSILSPCSK